ncbi:MAG: ribbon-helix-helix domain-containing protein [Acidimicrobiales bacterium]|nr:ribbon-helix-helix domain-containing protein [Acidimicrobiales bacterium]
MSLSDDEVKFLDTYAEEQGYASRSAVLRHAVRLLRANELSAAYEDAWSEWNEDGDADAWDATVADGVG